LLLVVDPVLGVLGTFSRCIRNLAVHAEVVGVWSGRMRSAKGCNRFLEEKSSERLEAHGLRDVLKVSYRKGRNKSLRTSGVHMHCSFLTGVECVVMPVKLDRFVLKLFR
jgi:hypothetical protein